MDLNADEDIVVGYMPFMRLVYESQAKTLAHTVCVGVGLWGLDTNQNCC